MSTCSKRVNQAVVLNCKSSVKVYGDVFQINPLLFQRLTLVADNLEDVFRFELCSYPQALCSGMPRSNKPVLANAIWSLLPDQVLQLPMILSMC